MTDKRRVGTREKALRINLDPKFYGSFSEIGAGQEVAASFFKAGASSGTVAITMSAYDMQISDSIYGETKRYVCEPRLMTMLDMEYKLITDKLPEKREKTCFFAFANTVETLNFHKTNQGHGWVGLKFQLAPNTEPNEVIIHVNLHDDDTLLQQRAMGILGVNLIYGCIYKHNDPEDLAVSLLDNLGIERVEVTMIRFSGPDFEKVDNRLMALKLVKNGLTSATLFRSSGEVLQAADTLYKKNILCLRGRFRPITHVNLDMLEKGIQAFLKEKEVDENNVKVLFELTLKDLTDDGEIKEKDFLDRVDIIGKLGHSVIISNYLKYYKLAQFLSSFTRGQKVGLVLGINNLQTMFEEKYYDNLTGGILEAFGLGFGNNVKLYVYPSLSNNSSTELHSLQSFQIKPNLKGLYQYMLDNDKVADLTNVNTENLKIVSDNVLKMIREGQSGWENLVPQLVAENIKVKGLFGYNSVLDKVN
jgi:hypothetical protein